MSLNDKLLKTAAAGALVPSEHFGVMLYEGDGSSSHSINGGKFGAGAYFDGTAYIDLNHKNTYTSFSISAWVNVKSTSSAQSIISSCLLYTSPSPRDRTRSRMPSSA